MLPFTPEGVLLQEGDVRREPPIVLALSASTPYRNGHLIRSSVAYRSSPPLQRRARGIFGMCERAAASSCWSPPWSPRCCGGQRPSLPTAPGQRHDRCPCASRQAVSRRWPALLAS